MRPRTRRIPEGSYAFGGCFRLGLIGALVAVDLIQLFEEQVAEFQFVAVA